MSENETYTKEDGTIASRPKKQVEIGGQSFFVDEDGWNSKLQIDGALYCIREMTPMQYREYQKKEKALNRRERDIAKERSKLAAKAKAYDKRLSDGADADEATEDELTKAGDALEDLADAFVDDIAALHESVVVNHLASWSFDRVCDDESKVLLSPSIKRRLAESIVRKSRLGQSDADFLGKR